MFYNCDYEMKQEDPSNHASGVGAPLKWTDLHTHTNSMPETARI